MMQISDTPETEFKETEVGLIPVDWDCVMLQSVTVSQSQKITIDPSKFPDEEFEYYSIPNLYDLGCSAPELGKNIRSQKLIIELGTVLFGKLNPRVPKVWLVRDSHNRRRIATTEFIPLVPSNVDELFLYFLTQSELVIPKSQTLVSGSTPSRQRIDVSKFLEIPIPLPPLPEQRRIATVLNAIQDEIAVQDDVLHELREFKRSTMEHLFTYGAGDIPAETKITEIGEIPAHWEYTVLAKVANIQRGKFAHRPRNEPRFYGGNIPFIQTGDVTASNGRLSRYSQTLNELGLSISKLFPKGTIVLTIAANIGDAAILEFDGAFPDSLVGITPNSDINVVFLNYYLQTQKHRMDALAPRGTQKNISLQFLEPYPAIKPPYEEQLTIANQLSSIDEKISAEEDRKVALQDFFRTTLQQLMTGQIRLLSDEGLEGI